MTTELLEFARREGSARLVLFLPGLSGSHSQWRQVVPLLQAESVDIAYGPAILRNSALGTGSPTVEAVAQALAELLPKLGYSHVVVVSHSVGAFVAFELAERAPSIVDGIVAVNGALYGVGRFLAHPFTEFFVRPATGAMALRLFALAAVPTPARLRKAIAKSEKATRLLLGRLVPKDAKLEEEARVALSEGTNQPEIIQGLKVNRQHWDRFARRSMLVACPVVFLVGELDPMNSASDAEAMARMIPEATVRILAGVGHAAPLERPTPILDAIGHFLAP